MFLMRQRRKLLVMLISRISLIAYRKTLLEIFSFKKTGQLLSQFLRLNTMGKNWNHDLRINLINQKQSYFKNRQQKQANKQYSLLRIRVKLPFSPMIGQRVSSLSHNLFKSQLLLFGSKKYYQTYKCKEYFLYYNQYLILKISSMKQDDALTETSMIIEPKFSSVLKSIIEPQLKCKGGYQIEDVCMNRKCKKPAFLCGNKKCNCYKDHLFCRRNWFAGITTLIKNKQNFQKQFFEKIYDTDNEMIQKVAKSNQEMATQISLGSFEDKYMQILHKIYYKQEWENFEGAAMDELYEKLVQDNQENKGREAQLQKIYANRALQLTEEGIKFKKEIFNAFLKNSLVKEPPMDKPFIDSPLIRTFLTTHYANTPQCYKNKEKFGFCYFEHLDADRKAFDKQYISFLQAQLYNAKSAELIYTASEFQFKSAEFHKKCDGVGQTLIVARTQYGKTIFAYAQQKWSSAGTYVNDTTNRSCIILLDIKKKCPATSPGNSIYCAANHGPTFGAHDIYFADSCNVNNSSCGFPASYNNGYTANQTSYTTICGQPSGNNFKFIEYQVFKLTF